MQDEDIALIDVVALSQQHCPIPIMGDLKYSYQENFVGRRIAGYETDQRDICLLAPNAATRLCQVQNFLVHHYRLSLLIFDAYRPLRAVKDFVNWFSLPPTPYELERKAIHFPKLEK